MTDYEEEKAMELEALQSIYMDDLTCADHYEIKLFPIPDAENPDENKEVNLPKEYPDQTPELLLRPIKGVSGKDCSDILSQCRNECQMSVGTPMIFTVTSIIKEWLDTHNDEVVAKKVEINQEYDAADDGTPVTPENYQLWWESFLISQSKVVITSSSKLTGKQYFAQSGSTALVAEAALETAAETGSADVDWELFAEEEFGDDIDSDIDMEDAVEDGLDDDEA